MLTLVPATVELLDAAIEGDAPLSARLSAAVADGWAVFPESLPFARDKHATEPGWAHFGTTFFVLDDPRTVVGIGGYRGPPGSDGAVEIGYALAPSFRGRGIATLAAKHLVERAFADPHVTSIVATTLPEENASTRVLRKLGFARTGSVSDPDVGEAWLFRLERRARTVEVSHVLRMGMTTYPGLPAPHAETLLDYDASRVKYKDGTEFFIASLHLCGNTGTYVDAPIHRYRGGVDLAGLPLARLADLPISVVRVPGERVVTAKHLAGVTLAGRAVLFDTGFSRHFGTDAYMTSNPYLGADACRRLVEEGALFVGVDSLNVDAIEDLARPAHTILLGAGIPVCEHMTNLAAVSESGRLHAVPIAWAGGATFPVRAYVVG